MSFPNPRLTGEDGLVCWGGELSTELLLEAYSKGIFPWPQEGYPMLWFCPEQRGVIEFEDFHIARKLAKNLKTAEFELRIDHDFEKVIANCQRAKRKHEPGTWITKEISKAYLRFYEKGYCHSFECWQNEKLVGGLYGVFVGGVFSGESMFHLVDDASKFCLVQAVEFLKKLSLTWIDTQMVTPLVKNFGGKYIDRDEYLNRIANSKKAIQWPRS